MITEKMIGRIVSAIDPLLVQGIIEEYTPLSTDKSLIPKLHQAVNTLFPEMDNYDRVLLFIAVVYRIFIPASFLPQINYSDRDNQALQKLPVGIRSIIAKCLGLKYPEEVNRYKRYSEPLTKSLRYKDKMNQVIEAVGLNQFSQKISKIDTNGK